MANNVKKWLEVDNSNIKTINRLIDYNIKNIDEVVMEQTPIGFKTEWVVAGDATARTITLPLVQNRAEGALAYNCVVIWGDGSANSYITSYDDADRIHTYAADGTYEVEILGKCEGWSFNNLGDKLKITKILDFGNSAGSYGFKYLAGAFYGCSNLTSMGTRPLLCNETGILTDGFYRMFQGCSKLTQIATDLFRYNINVTTSAFYVTFQGCSLITEIPVDTFRWNVKVTTEAFRYTFGLCTSLYIIPNDVFKYNVNVSTNGFRLTFNGCTSITQLPNEVFKYNVNCTSFYGALQGCINLTSLPNNIFRYNTLTGAEGFALTCQGCIKLQLNNNMFCDEATEINTRFLNRVSDFNSCFDRGSFSGTQGTAPKLWDYGYGTETPIKTSCFARAGNSATSLTNYADIPADWK